MDMSKLNKKGIHTMNQKIENGLMEILDIIVIGWATKALFLHIGTLKETVLDKQVKASNLEAQIAFCKI